MNRRQFTQRVAGSLAAAVATNILAAEKLSSEPKQAPSADVKHIALLAYPQFTALDLVAPQHLLGAVHGSKLHVVAKTRDILVSDTGMRIQPNMTLHECPEDLFVIFVPGGTKGTLDAMQDPAIIEFLADRASRAQYVTSVCTGSLILGAAGLLNGYRATSHWLVRDKVLPLLGATPVAERVVRDRNRITGGGVTAGLDFALNIVNASEGEEYTKATQLMAEYDPQPPFDAGSPQKAGEGPTQLLSRIFAAFVEEAATTAKSVSRRG